jgi:hypothetical protein
VRTHGAHAFIRGAVGVALDAGVELLHHHTAAKPAIQRPSGWGKGKG